MTTHPTHLALWDLLTSDHSPADRPLHQESNFKPGLNVHNDTSLLQNLRHHTTAFLAQIQASTPDLAHIQYPLAHPQVVSDWQQEAPSAVAAHSTSVANPSEVNAHTVSLTTLLRDLQSRQEDSPITPTEDWLTTLQQIRGDLLEDLPGSNTQMLAAMAAALRRGGGGGAAALASYGPAGAALQMELQQLKAAPLLNPHFGMVIS